MTDADRIKVLEECLIDCAELFSVIRNDYTDPRSECREGQHIIELALSLIRSTE